jgi:hypothetical protein
MLYAACSRWALRAMSVRWRDTPAGEALLVHWRLPPPQPAKR